MHYVNKFYNENFKKKKIYLDYNFRNNQLWTIN